MAQSVIRAELNRKSQDHLDAGSERIDKSTIRLISCSPSSQSNLSSIKRLQTIPNSCRSTGAVYTCLHQLLSQPQMLSCGPGWRSLTLHLQVRKMSMSLPSPGNEKIKTLGMPAAHANAKHAWNSTYEYNIQAACIYSTHTCVYHMCPCGVVSVTSPATTRLSPSPAPNCPGSILVAVGVQLHSAPRGGATFPNGAMGFRDFAKPLKCRKYTSCKKMRKTCITVATSNVT